MKIKNNGPIRLTFPTIDLSLDGGEIIEVTDNIYSLIKETKDIVVVREQKDNNKD